MPSTILLVEDDPTLSETVGYNLRHQGYDVTTAADGHAALAAARRDQPDLLLLDVMLPGLDGFEVCRRLKADPQTAAVPVIFLSASCSGEFRRRAFSVGAAEFLAKPFQTEELPTYIQAILRRLGTPTPTTGHVVAIIGASPAAGAADVATRLAETAALQGPGPAMLIDLELPTGSIGARLQLSGGPNVRILLQDTGEPVTREAIGRVAQRYHGGLEVMPAPYSFAALSQAEPLPQRLADTLDLLKNSCYYVVVHLGTRVNGLALTALGRAETIWAAADGDATAYEALLAEMAAGGINGAHILPTRSEPIDPQAKGRATTRARGRAQRAAESVPGALAVA